MGTFFEKIDFRGMKKYSILEARFKKKSTLGEGGGEYRQGGRKNAKLRYDISKKT